MGKKDFCCAEGCSHERSKGAKCAFYNIPSDPKIRKLWLSKISRVVRVEVNGRTVTKPWEPSKSSKLCGCHFDSPPPPKSRKKMCIIPNIFSHRADKKKTPRPKRERELVASVPTLTTKKCILPKLTQPQTEQDLDDVDDLTCPGVDIDQELCNIPDTDDHPYESPLIDHDYIKTTEDIEALEMASKFPDLIRYIQHSEINKNESEELNKIKLSGKILSYQFLKENPKLFTYYTGLSVDVFDALFEYLKDKANVMKYPYGARTTLFKHHAESSKRKPGKKRTYPLEEEMFFTLVKLRLGLQTQDCAVRFGMSLSTFSSISTAWITLIATELEKICKMPPTTETEQVQQAKCFEEFSNVRIVVDCTELFSETPSSVHAHKQFHSNYKHHTTVKFLVGMNTGGAITYISEMFGGRSSDKHITNESVDMLNALNPGEKVMADRGFTIQNELPAGVQLVIPSFKHKDKSQFSKRELQQNKKISEARVHIERAIRRIKQFQILATEMKLSQKDVYENIFKSCGYLVNFQDPFLKTEND